MTQLIAIFRASPGLVVLTLDLLHFEDPDHFTHDIVPVDLSRLTDLMLSRLSVRSLRDLLTHIRIPTCHRLKANCTHEPQVRVFDSQTAHLGSPIREILSATGLANIHLTPDTVEISTMLDDPANVGTATPNCALYLHLPSGPSLGPIGWLSRVFSAMIPPPTINLIIQAPTRSSQIIPLPSSLLPYVGQLCIIGSGTEAAMWIRLLSEPVTLANGEAQWTLPHLTRLVFDSCRPDAEDLIKMIRRRYGGQGGTAVTSRQDDVEQQLQPSREPVPLKYLQINSADWTLLSSQQMETLRSIVGSEACLIRGWENVDEMT
ncbi:hypothetical protein FRB97_009867 [Tulasnella sp. 331]|nr:hypothetical protein FRB97_009867 [Tulasnella sp. 331]KAG8890405.1 hypothetical protein FRB98_008980 [Tulasnella sp. 332]